MELNGEYAPDTVQVRIIELLASGHDTRAIAARLFLGESTVRRYIGYVRERTGVANRSELVAYAVRRGWLSREQPGHPG